MYRYWFPAILVTYKKPAFWGVAELADAPSCFDGGEFTKVHLGGSNPPPPALCGSSSVVEPHVANVDVASSNLVSRSISCLPSIYLVGIEKKLEVLTEMLIMAMIALLAAFFCFRVLLFPNPTTSAIDKTYDTEEILSER